MGLAQSLQAAKFVKSIVPQSINDTDTEGTAMDTLGFHYGLFVFHLGASTAAFDASGLNLTECATSGGTYTAVSGSAFTVPSSTNDDGFWPIYVDLRKRERYIKWHANPGAAATLLTAFGVLFRPDNSPVSDTDRNVIQSLTI